MNERLLSGNDFGVYLSKQTAKGAIDANPVFTPYRRTEGKLRKNVSYVQSSEVKTNRQARQNVKDNTDFSAEISSEFTKQTVSFLNDAIQGVETVVSNTSVNIAADANGFVASAGTPFSGMSVGDYVFVSGFSDAALNRNYLISAVNSALDIETSPVPTATEVEGASVTVGSNRTTSASTIPYFTAQTRMTDTSKVLNTDYQTFFDVQINTASFEIGESGTVTGSVAMVAEELVVGTGIVSGQTDAPADVSSPLSAVNDVVRIWVNGIDSDCIVKSSGFEFSNNMQEDRAPIDLSTVWRDRYLDGTLISLAFELNHGGGEFTIIEIPQAVITEHQIPDTTSVVANSEMTYVAEEDSRGFTAVVYRNWV